MWGWDGWGGAGGCEGVGGTQWGTDHRDQYIISYKLNSTWIDPQDVCDCLRSADGCTVNPTDQQGGLEVLGSSQGGRGPGWAERPQSPTPPIRR